MFKRLIRGAMVTIMLAGAFIGIASAAGASSFSYYMTSVFTNFNSRTWTSTVSANSSINSTSCNSWQYGTNPSGGYQTGNYTLQLTQETPWYEPDINRGQHQYTCDSSFQGAQNHNFGTQTAASYHFTVVGSTYGTDVGGLDATGITTY